MNEIVLNGGFELFEFEYLLFQAKYDLRKEIDIELELIMEAKKYVDIGSSSMSSYRREQCLKALIAPFQRRAEKLHTRGTCYVAGCKATDTPFKEGGLAFCEEHEWVYDAHCDRHESGGNRLPVLMLVWDDTGYRHALAGADDIRFGFAAIWRMEMNRFEHLVWKFIETLPYAPIELLKELYPDSDEEYCEDEEEYYEEWSMEESSNEISSAPSYDDSNQWNQTDGWRGSTDEWESKDDA